MSAGITFGLAWDRDDQELKHGARDFWAEFGALKPDQVDERVKELCAVGYLDGKVVAASTVRPLDIGFMRSRFFYYRTMVRPDLRQQRVAWRLLAFSHNRLSEWARMNPTEQVKGVTFTLEAQDLFRARRSLPVIAEDGLNLIFVGYASSGQQIRVVWFDDATIE